MTGSIIRGLEDVPSGKGEKEFELKREQYIHSDIRVPLSAIASLSSALADKLEGEEAQVAHLIADSCEKLLQRFETGWPDPTPAGQVD